jgi:four helix bundle protein
MKENIIQTKSYAFSLRVVKLYKHFIANRIEYVLIKQLLRSSVSIGANVEEAIGAQTKKDFISKINISYKEARETKYWLRLLRDSDFLKPRSRFIIDGC